MAAKIENGNIWEHGLLVDLADQTKWLMETENAVIIRDRFPKAMYHFLVLPKADVPSIFVLTKNDINLLNEIFSLACEFIRSKGRKLTEFRTGYHAEPSLLQLHMHIISTDYCSPTLRTKRHYNSFNTKLFIPHDELVLRLCKHGKIHKMGPYTVEKVRKKTLKCNRCDYVNPSIEIFKEHLLTHLTWK